MTADFNWFLNKQGPRGQQGVKGEQGFSPVITVAEDTAKAYILRIQTQDDTFLTPNLRGTVDDLGGTYVRYNRETGRAYAGSPDIATTETYGVTRLATQQDVINLAQDTVVTPELLVNQIEALDLSDDYVTVNTPQKINASKTFTSGISLSSIHNADGAEVLNFVSGEPFKFKTLNNGLNVEGGTLRVIDGSIKSKSAKQLSTDANVYDVVTSFDLATTENAGIVKPDNSTVFIDGNGIISAKTGAIDDNRISAQSSWSSSKTNAEISTVAQEVVGIQGNVASLDTDVNILKPIVESNTTSIGSINDSLATAMSDITELKGGKQDKLIRYPIEISDKSLMPSWYVVYNDGWCEQGGRLTSKGDKTLLKNYADINYGVHLTYNGGTNWGNPPYINGVTTSGFHFDTTSSGVSSSAYVNWSAAGFLDKT